MIEFLSQVPLFSKLNEQHLKSISEICTRKLFHAGTILFREKEIGATFYIVYSGSVKIFTTHSGGEEKILAVFNAGESFGELSLIDGKPRSATAQTLEDSGLISLDGIHFMQLLRSNFDMTKSIMEELCSRLRDTNEHVQDLTFLDARTRVLKSLIKLANKSGKRSGTTIDIKLALNYDELARMAGVEKNVLIQVLRDLQEKRIVILGPSHITLDLAKLR
jgi:CRP/FNR family transcriptional regulator/CRP/FNR family cyclic AMP-dependent transcriptional regulator